MKVINYNPSYYDIEKACGILAKDIVRCETLATQRIVGLARGGLIPSVILSHLINIPLVSISYSSRAGQGEFKGYDNTLPDIESHNVLLVDDICDSGHTLSEVEQYYNSKGYRVRTVALFYKEGAVMIPNYFWQTLPKDAPWVTFPWEV